MDQTQRLAKKMYSTPPQTATSGTTRHTATSSLGSSASFYTVNEHCAAGSSWWVRQHEVRRRWREEGVSLERSKDESLDSSVDREDVVEECLTPLRDSNDDDRDCRNQSEDEESGEGYPIKPLPNGMQSLPSPQRSSFEESLPTTPRTIQPVLPVRQPISLTASSDTLSTTSHSHPTSHTTATTNTSTPPIHSSSAFPHANSMLLGSCTDWTSQFWYLVHDACLPENAFFANPMTGECRWTLPAGTLVVTPRETGEWWQLIDVGTGREYYHHTRSGESRWTRPRLAEGEWIVPMVAVQLSKHGLSQGLKGDSVAQSSEKVVERVGLEQQQVVQLRRRTRSVPKSSGGRDSMVERRTSSRSVRPVGDSVDVQKVTQSILSHDRKLLDCARRTYNRAFHTSPRSQRSTNTRSPTSVQPPAMPTTTSISPPITKLGNGLAFHPEPKPNRHRSLPFLHPHCRRKQRQRVDLPPDLTAALLAACALENTSSPPTQALHNPAPIKHKLTRLFRSLTPCTRSHTDTSAGI